MVVQLYPGQPFFRAEGVPGSPPVLGTGHLVSSNLTCPTIYFGPLAQLDRATAFK